MAGPVKNEEALILKLTDTIETNLKNQQFGVNELARFMGMERSTLHRKLYKISNVSVSQFISQVKLKHAMNLLQKTSLSISEVAYDSGFHSVTYFSKCFHDFYGFPPGEAKNRDAPTNLPGDKKSISLRHTIALAASLLLIVFLVIALIFHERLGFSSVKPKEQDKTIAVLPIKIIGQSADNELFLKGLQSEIISNMGTIDFITVISPITYPEEDNFSEPVRWAKKLKINYLIEGTCQTDNQIMRIRIMMTNVFTGKIVYSAFFNSDVTSEDPLTFQNEISQIVRREIRATFLNQDIWAPQTTSNLEANENYQKANHYRDLYTLKPESTAYRQLAWHYYLETIRHDPNFPPPYTIIGWFYHNMSITEDVFLNDRYLDSALIWFDKSEKVHFNGFPGALLKSQVLSLKGESDEALRIVRKAIDKIPHEPSSYRQLAFAYACRDNYPKAVESLLLTLKFRDEPYSDIWTNRQLVTYLTATGFTDEAESFMQFVFDINQDSVEYLTQKAWSQYCNGHIEKAVQSLMPLFEKDSTLTKVNQYLFLFSLMAGNQKEMTNFAKRIKEDIYIVEFQPNVKGGLGWYHWEIGETEKALALLKAEIKRNQDINTLHNYKSKNYSTAFNLACLHAATGEKEKAIRSLNELINKEYCPVWYITSMKSNPMLASIRETPEFDNVLKHLELIYLKEHDLVASHLRELEKERHFLDHP